LRNIGSDESCIIDLFRSLHDAGIPTAVLKSLALASTRSLPHAVRDHCTDRLALFLAQPKQHSKLAVVRTLMVLCTPLDQSWQLEEGCLKETLQFVTDRSHDWVFAEHSEHVLLWELRAKCCRFQELPTESRLEIEHVVRGSHVVAEYIASAAQWVERGLRWSVPHLEGGLELAGSSVKSVLTPSVANVSTVATSCSSAAKHATDGVRETTRRTVHGIRDVSTRTVQRAVESVQLDRIVPSQDHRDVLCAAGTVGMAGLGAAAIVGEALYETTRAVSQKTVAVAADIVRYKYGDAAGQVVQDTSDAADNICRTMAHFSMLKVVAKSVAKNASKNQVRAMYEHDKDDLEHFWDPTKADALAVVHKIQRPAKAKRKSSCRSALV